MKIFKICQRLWKLSKIAEIVKIVKNNCQNFSPTVKICQKCKKLSKIVHNYQKLSKMWKSVKNFPQLSKIVHNYQKLYNIVNNCQHFQKLSNIVKNDKLVKNFNILVRSCFLITVIKCLKDHKSLMSKQKVAHWLSQWQCHLLSCPQTPVWTAKKETSGDPRADRGRGRTREWTRAGWLLLSRKTPTGRGNKGK